LRRIERAFHGELLRSDVLLFDDLSAADRIAADVIEVMGLTSQREDSRVRFHRELGWR
jgi:hypothetical protein